MRLITEAPTQLVPAEMSCWAKNYVTSWGPHIE